MKQLSTRNTDRRAFARSYHHIHEKFLKVYHPVAPDGMLSYWKKNLPENTASEKYTKQMPSGFTHFYCHRVVLSTQKNCKAFYNISGRLVAARQNPTAKNIVSGPLILPQRPAQNPDH